jgi:hypothetical protein
MLPVIATKVGPGNEGILEFALVMSAEAIAKSARGTPSPFWAAN